MVVYDPKVVEEYAERLYQQSRSIVTCHFFIGVFAGMLIFAKVADIMVCGFDPLIISIGVVIGAVMGYGSGQNRSAEMKLEAQLALCRVEVARRIGGSGAV